MGADFVEQRPLAKYPGKSGRDILDVQYRGGRSVIEKADWARNLYDVLKRRCPNVPEEHLVRLFHDRGQSQLEFIQGGATFLEYNARHPLGKRRIRVRSRPASAVRVAPAPPPKAAPKPAPKPAPAAKKAKAAPRPKPAPARGAVRPAAKKAVAKAKRRR